MTELAEGQLWLERTTGCLWRITFVDATRVDYVREGDTSERRLTCSGRPHWHITNHMDRVAELRESTGKRVSALERVVLIRVAQEALDRAALQVVWNESITYDVEQISADTIVDTVLAGRDGQIELPRNGSKDVSARAPK